jgi:hypothetical protein
LHSCIILPPVSHSSTYKTIECVLNFYRSFKVFIRISLVNIIPSIPPSSALQAGRVIWHIIFKNPTVWAAIEIYIWWKTSRCV